MSLPLSYVICCFLLGIKDARKIWSFGCPPDGKVNVIVDMTKSVAYLHEIKDSVVSAFLEASSSGVFCGEAMRGIRFNLVDTYLHADAIHRGAGQIMPPTKRALYACQIKSDPALLEPVYLCDITVPNHGASLLDDWFMCPMFHLNFCYLPNR